MNVLTLASYLFGSRDAILKIASSRQAIWIGLLLVFSAGLAREYDGEDLLYEPWHLLLPLAASLATSLLLYVLVFAAARRRRCRELAFLAGYRSFLGLYWMTAPLAWLYAIPVERFMSAGDATSANLWLLAIVSVWRVALMTRVISVLFESGNSTVPAALVLVMFFGNTLLLVLLHFIPVPIFAVMGGIRLNESERVLQAAALFTGCIGLFSWPIWAIAALAALTYGYPVWRFRVSPGTGGPATLSTWTLTVLSIAVWIFVLPSTQSEQQLRGSVERQFEAGNIAEALMLMSAHQRSDFPPHWDPPPRLAFRQPKPPILDVMEAVVAGSPSPWVRQLWLEKFQSEVERVGPFHQPAAEEMHRYVALLEALPEARVSIRDDLHEWGLLQDSEDYPEALRERIRRLLEQQHSE